MITHKYITGEIERLISVYAAQGFAYAIVDGAALIESGFAERCRLTVAVLADRGKRLDRIVARDAISAETALQRMDAQRGDDFYIKNTDYTVYNNGGEEYLRAVAYKVMELLI